MRADEDKRIFLGKSWGREGKAAVRRLDLSKSIQFLVTRLKQERKRKYRSFPGKKILSKLRRFMEGVDAKPPPYNYGAIPTDAGQSAPPPYSAGGL